MDDPKEVRARKSEPHLFVEENLPQENPEKENPLEKLILDPTLLPEVVVTELSIKPNQNGKFDLFWDCQNPGRNDWIGIFIDNPPDPNGRLSYLGYASVNSRSSANESTGVNFVNNDTPYYAVYISQENKKYAFKKSVRVEPEKHETSLSENKTLELNWSKPTSVGYYDYIALFDFKPRIGTEDAKRYLTWQWQWAVNAASGLYQTGTSDDGKTIFYAAYCSWTNKGYSIVDIAGIVTGYEMKEAHYDLNDCPPPKYDILYNDSVTLINRGDHPLSCTSAVTLSNTSTQTWSSTYGWKIGVNVQFDARIPFFSVGGKWQISAETNGSYTTGSSATSTHTFANSVTMVVSSNKQVDGTAILLVGSSPKINYEAELGVKYRGEHAASHIRKINGVYTSNASEKVEITVGAEHDIEDKSARASLLKEEGIPVRQEHRYTFFHHPTEGWPSKPQLVEELPLKREVGRESPSMTK